MIAYWNSLFNGPDRENVKGLNKSLSNFDLAKEGVLQRITALTLVITADRSKMHSVEKARAYQVQRFRIRDSSSSAATPTTSRRRTPTSVSPTHSRFSRSRRYEFAIHRGVVDSRPGCSVCHSGDGCAFRSAERRSISTSVIEKLAAGKPDFVGVQTGDLSHRKRSRPGAGRHRLRVSRNGARADGLLRGCIGSPSV